jgi:anti-sigma factor RsiW
MNECERIGESIGRWLDGELDSAEGELVRAHVTACARCSEERRRLERIDRALSSILVAQSQKIEFASFWRRILV